MDAPEAGLLSRLASSKTMAWEYQDRGWPWFESNIANMRGVSSFLRLEFAEEIIKLEDVPDMLACQASGLPMLAVTQEQLRDGIKRSTISYQIDVSERIKPARISW